MWYQTLVRAGDVPRMWRGTNLHFNADTKGPFSSIHAGPWRTTILSIVRSETRLSGYIFFTVLGLMLAAKSAFKPAINKEIKESEQKVLRQKLNEIGFKNKVGVSTRPLRSSEQFTKFLEIENELDSALAYSDFEGTKAMLEASYIGLDGPLGEEDRIVMAYQIKQKELFGKKAKKDH